MFESGFGSGAVVQFSRAHETRTRPVGAHSSLAYVVWQKDWQARWGALGMMLHANNSPAFGKGALEPPMLLCFADTFPTG